MTLAFTSLNVWDDLVLCRGFFHLESIHLACRNPRLRHIICTRIFIKNFSVHTFQIEMASLSQFYINTSLQCYCLDRIDRFIQYDLKIFCPDISICNLMNLLWRQIISGGACSRGAFSLEAHVLWRRIVSGADILRGK